MSKREHGIPNRCEKFIRAYRCSQKAAGNRFEFENVPDNQSPRDEEQNRGNRGV